MSALPFTLRQLEVFSSLCTTRSFRRSAENLGISQASISSQMKILEAQLGITLLDRSPGKLTGLTPSGMAFQEDLRAFEAAGKRLASHRKNDPNLSVQTCFRLLVGQGLFDYYIRPKLSEFLGSNPQIDLEFDVRSPDHRVARLVADDAFDFGLFHLRADRQIGSHLRALAQLHGGVYGHERFAKGRELPLSPDEISQLPFVLPQSRTAHERETLLKLEEHGISPRRVVCHTHYYDVIAGMLDSGTAVANFASALIPPEMRAHICLLFQMENWRLVWFRKDSAKDKNRDAIEKFLISSVVNDATYPAIKLFAPNEKVEPELSRRSGLDRACPLE